MPKKNTEKNNKTHANKTHANKPHTKQVSKAIRDEAMTIARSRQLPGQTKEQTKIIAQGIEKGITQYMKQQGEKSRELDKKIKHAKRQQSQVEVNEIDLKKNVQKANVDGFFRGKMLSSVLFSSVLFSQGLPWALLSLTWVGIIIYMAT